MSLQFQTQMDANIACHVLAVPYPGRGHVNPMMNLCKLLAAAAAPNTLLITFVVTEEWLRLIGAQPKPPSIRFASIPNVLPSERDRAADMPSFVRATQTKMAEPFDKLVEGLGAPVHFIIADTCLGWAVEMGNRRNIPVASMWAMPASVFSIFYHFDLFVRNGQHPVELSERGEERVGYIPGIPSIRLSDMPSIAHLKDQRLLHLVLSFFPNVRKAQYLLFTSVHELESPVIHALKQEFAFPIYTFGPAIPYFDDHITAGGGYMDWLDSQPPRSVLYVSLGSFLSVSPEQMDEIAGGLRDSGARFLWSARGDVARLQEKCGEAGIVVPWCDQLKVLRHAAVGGFWTHCGWNSTMEAIYGGVPIIAFPIIMDQMTIRKYVVEDWGIGWDGKRGVRGAGGELVRRGEVARIVKECMDLEGAERKEIGGRAEQLRKAVVEAVSEGGSSKVNLGCLLSDILSFGSS